jgi:ribosomal protein S20
VKFGRVLGFHSIFGLVKWRKKMTVSGIVERATSELLAGPDWAINVDLCDVINNDPSQAKDVIKTIKRRLTNRNPMVQLLALTLLETLIRNCGDNVHQHIQDREVLQEMVKIMKKKVSVSSFGFSIWSLFA